MKKWIVTYSYDFKTLEKIEVEGKNYADAYVSGMIKLPGAAITELKLKEE